jgi:hypothetical protein
MATFFKLKKVVSSNGTHFISEIKHKQNPFDKI